MDPMLVVNKSGRISVVIFHQPMHPPLDAAVDCWSILVYLATFSGVPVV